MRAEDPAVASTLLFPNTEVKIFLITYIKIKKNYELRNVHIVNDRCFT